MTDGAVVIQKMERLLVLVRITTLPLTWNSLSSLRSFEQSPIHESPESESEEETSDIEETNLAPL